MAEALLKAKGERLKKEEEERKKTQGSLGAKKMFLQKDAPDS